MKHIVFRNGDMIFVLIIHALVSFGELLGNPLTIALTATATHDVQQDIIKKLHIDKEDIKLFHQGIERPNLRLETVDVFDDKEKLKAIISTLEKYSWRWNNLFFTNQNIGKVF